ncbi:MAG: glycosyltransferase family 39 protein [Acidimicrobiia bacterium]|nr:glycosyltransferase family 39 protein [Acidimicrobiia bacterium]
MIPLEDPDGTAHDPESCGCTGRGVNPAVPARSATLGRLDTSTAATTAARSDASTGQRHAHFGRWLGAIAVAALVVRVLFTVVVDPSIGESPDELSDPRAYHLIGKNLSEGRGYVRPFDLELLGLEHPSAEYPPLFPAFLAVLDGAGVDSVDGQQLALCLVGSLTVLGIGLVGRRVGGDAVGLTAAAIAAIYPNLFQADAVLMTESPHALLVTVATLLAFRAADRPSRATFAALGLALGLGALSRSEGALFAPLLVLPLALLLRDRSRATRLGLAAVALAVALAVVAPWTIRNYVRFDAFVPISNNVGPTIDGANCDLTYSGTYLGYWRSTFGDTAAESDECFEGFDITQDGFNEAETAAFHRDAGLRYARDHASRLPVVAMARLGRAFGFYDTFDQVRLESLEGRTVRWQTLGLRMYWLLLPFAVAGAVLVRRRTDLVPLLTPFVLVAITVVLTHGNERFRISAEPALVVLAAMGAVAAVRAARHRIDRQGANR